MITQKTRLVKEVAAFADAGAKFTRVPRRSKIPQDKSWQLRGFSLDVALAHAQRGGNVGVLLGEAASRVICLDFDTHFAELCISHPRLANTWRVTRSDAPDRGKLFLRVRGELPRTKSYKKNGREIQLLSTGAQAVVHGQHPDGGRYEACTEGTLLEVTLSPVAAFWSVWTGEELQDKTEPQPTPRRARRTTPGDNLVARVKAAWPSALEVFEHHSLASKVVREGRQQWRLLGNGGLICGDGEAAWRWYCHAEGVGGDQIDAWGYCTYSARWDRHNVAMFKAILHDMAEAAGIPTEREKKGQLPNLQWLKGWATSWDGWNPRTRETDRAAFIELLYLAEERGSDTLDIGCRELAERVGCGHDTAAKALTRLAELGLIEVAEQADAYHAATWQICTQIRHTPSVGGMCPVGVHILNGDDAFLWGSRIASEHTRGEGAGSIGPTGKSFLAALLATNDLSVGEIAQRTGMHRNTAGKKARTLAALRLLKLRKVGRTVICHLVGHWKTLLDTLRRRMTTFGRGLRRKIAHVVHRVGHTVWLLQHLPERLEEYRARILATWERGMAMLEVLELELGALLGEAG